MAISLKIHRLTFTRSAYQRSSRQGSAREIRSRAINFWYERELRAGSRHCLPESKLKFPFVVQHRIALSKVRAPSTQETVTRKGGVRIGGGRGGGDKGAVDIVRRIKSTKLVGGWSVGKVRVINCEGIS